MADERSAVVSVGDRDPELAEVLDKGLDEYNFAATGTSAKDQGSFSVKVTGADGEIIGGLTAWTWAGLWDQHAVGSQGPPQGRLGCEDPGCG